jgi:hypothetical protein
LIDYWINGQFMVADLTPALIQGDTMQRKALDRLVSWVGFSLAVLLVVAGGLLTWANNFISHEVKTQLSAQQIFFPPKGSEAIAGPEFVKVRQYAGQQLTTGAQAQVYADHFIGVHLSEVANGQTYAQLSGTAKTVSTKLAADPTNKALQASSDKLTGQVATMFKGETLRGLLLNAYAFGTMATIAGIAAIAAFVGGGVLLLLALLGLVHARRVTPAKTVFTGQHEAITPAAV